MKATYSILRTSDRESLDYYIGLMTDTDAAMMKRKHPVAVYQQAWCLKQATERINNLLEERARVHVAVIGVLDDPIYKTLIDLYGDTVDIAVCDPVVNGKTSRTLVEEGVIVDIVIACSVWEHDPDVRAFFLDLHHLSRSAIVLTADFHPAYYNKSVPSTSFRVLDEPTLISSILNADNDIELEGNLECDDTDLFCWEGCWYYFLKMVVE